MDKVLIVLSLFILSSCAANSGVKKSENDQRTVADVVAWIKKDISQFQMYSDSIPNQASQTGCNGYVNFSIETIKVAMKVVTIEGKEAKAGIVLPIGAVKIGPEANGSRKETTSQILTFTIYPQIQDSSTKTTTAPIPMKASEINYKDSPIASTLASLRENLLETSNVSPCMSFENSNKDKDTGSTFEFGFGVESKKAYGGGVELAILSIGASKSGQNDFSNTITVTFKGKGLKDEKKPGQNNGVGLGIPLPPGTIFLPPGTIFNDKNKQ